MSKRKIGNLMFEHLRQGKGHLKITTQYFNIKESWKYLPY